MYVFVAIIEYKGGSATMIHTCPLLFPIFINDIVDEIQCNIRLFADDTSLHSVVEDAYEAAIKLILIQRKYMNGQRWLVNFKILTRKSLKAMTISKRLISLYI